MMRHVKIPTVRTQTASLPVRSTAGSAGHDLCAQLGSPMTLQPGQRKIIATGIRLALPGGTFGMICPRSGLALRHGVTVLNAPGIIDHDYRGDIGVILVNLGDEPFLIEHGMRIAQIVFVPVDGLNETARGSGGLGSTGLSGPAPSMPRDLPGDRQSDYDCALDRFDPIIGDGAGS